MLEQPSAVCSNPVVPLYPFQARVLRDPARLIGWLKSRQIGGSFTCTLKMVLHAIETGEDWNTMSRTQRQAEKLLKKAATHVKAINEYVQTVLKSSPIVKPDDIGTRRITLLNGAALEALPCDSDTTTGDTCNWLIDEFALFPGSEEVFAVIKPSIMHGRRMLVVSSPRGRRNKFFELHERFARGDSGWSFHKVTIKDAIDDGFAPTNENGRAFTFEEFEKQEVGDMGAEMFGREYMCRFSDKLVAFLTHALVKRCTTSNLRMSMTSELLIAIGRDLYVGVDIGRRHDLTVIWVVSKSGDAYVTEAVHRLDRTPFREQERVIRTVLDSHRVVSCMIDENGCGMQLAENMKADYPGVVVPFSFTNPSKAEIAGRLKASMESEAFWMPNDDAMVEDFASIERNVTAADNVTIAAPVGSGGHGDMFWAAALAVHAAATMRPFELVMVA